MIVDVALYWLLALPAVAATAISRLSNPAAGAIFDDASKRTGNYTDTCSDITIDGHQILHGWCAGGSHDNEGNPNASLNLNLCVAYDHWSKALAWSPK
jgi:hypothetical protein